MQKQLAWQKTRVHHLDLHVKDATSSAGFYRDLRRKHEAKRTLYLGRALPPAAAQAKSLTKSPSAPTTRANAAWPRVISDHMQPVVRIRRDSMRLEKLKRIPRACTTESARALLLVLFSS